MMDYKKYEDEIGGMIIDLLENSNLDDQTILNTLTRLFNSFCKYCNLPLSTYETLQTTMKEHYMEYLRKQNEIS